jgi:dipeptidyl aminopeptidase/acylaminoacyl peptidase
MYLTASVTAIIQAVSCNRKPSLIPAKQYPVEDFFRNPDKVDFALSPDGKHYAYLAPYKSRLNIFVQEIGKANPFLLTRNTARNISWFFWGDNKRILFLKDKAGDGNMRMFGINIDGTNLVSLTDFDQINTEVINELVDNEDYIIIGLNKRDPQVSDPYRLNINTGELTQIEENIKNLSDWKTDNEGKLRLATGDNDGTHYTIFFRQTENEIFRPIYTTNPGESFYPLFFTTDNRKFYAISNVGRETKALVEFNPVTGKEDSILYENIKYDVMQVDYSYKQKIPVSALFYSWKKEYHFFEPQNERMYEYFESEFGQKQIDIVSTSRDEAKRIILVSGDKSMGSYYLYDQETREFDKIADTKPWLDENEMADMIPVEYLSRDGLTIHGYITFPKGYDLENAKNMPTVINPHGGPWARDIWGFTPRVQFLANRGYVIFQMNFRGSTGYGKSFTLASQKEWGKSMQNDITDGVEWLINNGIADPDRIAIYGASFGGYATLAGIAFTPDLYSAAIDYCGISNIFTFYEGFSSMWKPLLEWYYHNLGDPVKDSVLLREISPIYHVDSIRTPLLIIHGANDNSVKVSESNQIVEALRNRGYAVEYLLKENEGHIFRNEENVIEVYKSIDRFLKKYLNN